MRIISGKLKGKKIFYFKSFITRPLKDFVKENIFNVITHSKLIKINLKYSNVLDLYSGIGSFGIECISRGAQKIYFVENDKRAVSTLKENLIHLSVEKNAKIISSSIENCFEKIEVKKFDIFFLDPPFSKKEYLNDLKKIKEMKIYSKNHIVIIHRENKSNENFSNILEPILIKTYRRSKIIFGRFL